MRLVLVGKTGSGKTTAARTLAEQCDVPRVSSGDIARRMASEQEQIALRSGLPAPEEAMRHIVHEELERAEATRGGWILEGFPYYIAQLICLLQWTSELPDFVHLAIDDWTAIERLVTRGRPDDNPDAIERKLMRWNTMTTPMLELLADAGATHTIDATMPTPLVVTELEAFA